jgi:hypothetical protein
MGNGETLTKQGAVIFYTLLGGVLWLAATVIFAQVLCWKMALIVGACVTAVFFGGLSLAVLFMNRCTE